MTVSRMRRMIQTHRLRICAAFASVALAALVLPHVAGANPSSAAPTANAHAPASVWRQDATWFQHMIYLYASGNVPIQQAAATTARQNGLSATQTARLSAAVRATWVQLMSADPASIGRTGAAPNVAAQQQALAALRTTLRQIAGTHYGALLAASDQTYARVASPTWLHANALAASTPRTATASSYVSVYATSFSIPFRKGLLYTRKWANGYVALPDAYLKYANMGWNSDIPAFEQPYYLPSTGGPPYTVDIATSAGSIVAQNVLVGDVGPWNEDDNWWDPTNTSASLPASCHVSTTPRSSASLTNPAVDGICPSTKNWRRVYYYLLYKHFALPFFQSGAYAPSGSFAESSAWPTPLSQICPEASAASINNDGVTCIGSLAGYNGNNSSWLRDGTANKPVLNQAGIDLGPSVDAALGWTWPSSGFVQVNVSRLP